MQYENQKLLQLKDVLTLTMYGENMQILQERNGQLTFAILNENGGLIPDDFREGEVSVEQLWSEIQETLTGEKLPVPHVFRFSTNPST